MSNKTQVKVLDGLAGVMAILTVVALVAMVVMNPVAAIGTAAFFAALYLAAAKLFW